MIGSLRARKATLGSVMDFVAAWKAISIALTGAFGLMGLLTENKNKEAGKLTTWGKVSFSGIVLSTTLGVAAQLKETADEAQRREASATQTLQLLKQTSRAVFDIQRLLSPFDVSELSLAFEVACEDQKFATFCAQARKLKDSGKWPGGEYTVDPAVWKMWPEQPRRLPEIGCGDFWPFQARFGKPETCPRPRTPGNGSSPGSPPPEQKDPRRMSVCFPIQPAATARPSQN